MTRPAVDAPPGSLHEPLVFGSETPLAWIRSGIFRGSPAPARVVNGWVEGDLPGDATRTIVEPSQLFIADVETREVTQITSGTGSYFNPNWSPDGRTIVFASADGEEMALYNQPATNLYLLDVKTRRVRPLATGPGWKRLPMWSPSGDRIAFFGGPPLRAQSVWIVNAGGGAPRQLGRSFERRLHTYEWHPDGRSLLAQGKDGTSTPIIRLDAATGLVTPITPTNLVTQAFAIARSGALAWVEDHPMRQQMLLVTDRIGVEPRPILRANPEVDRWRLGEQEVVHWIGARGDTIDGILIRPVGYQAGRRYPLIVDAYSGFGHSFRGSTLGGNQLLAARGYAVLLTNQRSPHMVVNLMKSPEYSEIAAGPSGLDVLISEVLGGVDLAIAQGIADPERVCLLGHSNGGHAAMQLVTHTDRFRCAAVLAPAYLDWARSVGTGFTAISQTNTGGRRPWSDPDAFIALSPFYQLARVTTPVLLAAGELDRFIFLETNLLYGGLRALGKDVTMLRYANQGHRISGAALEDLWKRLFEFYATYLHGAQ